ncbi:MAG: hypothetical protein V3V20_08805 [Algisphaera sp.]
MSDPVSRRDLLLGRFRRAVQSRAAQPSPPATPAAHPAHAPAPNANQEQTQSAIIMGRHCLAYQHVTCSTCYERCPVQGAIVRDAHRLPRVVSNLCTGCRICHDVCPAPTNAVLMIAGRPPQGPPTQHPLQAPPPTSPPISP